eukprot:Phypoly_transcript_26790.p1 GENE.Phypoly_transcript_26790~~Phypoly_transcript_26790.p1  ORF type:complete len:104 (+),score=18.37 Phypoly_transcript_26790:162-473(+)
MPHIEHVLFFKLKPLTDEEYTKLYTMAMGLKEKIPGILEISLGKHTLWNPNDRSGGYTHGFRVKFVDSEALKVYGPHEEHQKFVALLSTLRESPPLCLDWQVE